MADHGRRPMWRIKPAWAGRTPPPMPPAPSAAGRRPGGVGGRAVPTPGLIDVGPDCRQGFPLGLQSHHVTRDAHTDPSTKGVGVENHRPVRPELGNVAVRVGPVVVGATPARTRHVPQGLRVPHGKTVSFLDFGWGHRSSLGQAVGPLGMLSPAEQAATSAPNTGRASPRNRRREMPGPCRSVLTTVFLQTQGLALSPTGEAPKSSTAGAGPQVLPAFT